MGRIDYETETMIAHSLRAEGFDASEDGTGRGTPIVPVTVAVNETVGAMCAESGPNTHGSRGVSGSQTLLSGYIQPVAFQPIAFNGRIDPVHGPVPGALDTDPLTQCVAIQDGRAIDTRQNGLGVNDDGSAYTVDQTGAHAPAIAIQERAVSENASNGPDGIGVRTDGASYTLEARTVPQAVMYQDSEFGAAAYDTAGSLRAGREPHHQMLVNQWAVRRLMPVECARLQGFPDTYLDITYRGKPAADGPKYKALGNSMAVNVMRWIGRRIEMVEQISAELEKEEAA
jgi:DNA (cytosine-5)-methyltransferase 1